MEEEGTKSKFIPLLLLWISMFIFSAANSVIAKLGKLGAMHLVDGRNPISFCNVLFAANIIAGVVLFGINHKSWNRESLSQVKKKDWWNMLFLAILSGVIGPTLFFLGLMLTEVINVVLISTIDIPLTLILAWAMLKEKPTKGGVYSSIFSIIGILVIFFLVQNTMPEQMKMTMINVGDGFVAHFLTTFPFSGELCIALATFFTVFSVEYSKKAVSTIPLGIFSVFRMIVGAIIFFIVVLSVLGPVHFIDIFNLYLLEWMLFYGGVIIALGLFLWYKGMSQTSSSDLAVTNSFQPIAGVIFAYLILGEIPTTAQLVGGVIIMVGVAIALVHTLREERKKKLNELSKARGFTGV